MNIFITGNGTDVGKTVVSAILCQAQGFDYWKPIQCGSLDNTDTDLVRSWVTNPKSRIHPEAFKLKGFMSPHAAAELESVNLSLDQIRVPSTQNSLLIEGAGGLHVPLNNKQLMIDLILHLNAKVIFVSKNYLGSINHTLLSLEALKSRNIEVMGIIFNGAQVASTESFILSYSGIKMLGRIREEENINQDLILSYAEQFKNIVYELG